MTDAHFPTAIATSTGAGTFQARLEIGASPLTATLIADEPLSLKGLGTGPNPYDLLAAALATCTTMTLRWHAARKGWDIGTVSTQVTHARVPGATPPDQFDCTITLAPGIDQAMRDDLLTIAERCPVHKTLTAGAGIATRLFGA